MPTLPRYKNLINKEVVTEAGIRLGRVRDVKFTEEGSISSLVMASLSTHLIPTHFINCYEISGDEIITCGDLLIVLEKAEERIHMLTVGILKSLGVSKYPWERTKKKDLALPTHPISRRKRTNKNSLTPSTHPEFRRFDDYGLDDDGVSPAYSPRRPSPKPGTNSAEELPPILQPNEGATSLIP